MQRPFEDERPVEATSLVTRLLLSAASGAVWGIVGYWLVSDTNLRGGALLGLVVSPFIGVFIGLLAVEAEPATTIGRALWALMSLYLAVGLFALVVGSWQVTIGWDTLSEGLRSSGRIRGLGQAALSGLVWFTFAGYALMLWPLSIGNHLLIWRSARWSS
jgi:hypothetical protein